MFTSTIASDTLCKIYSGMLLLVIALLLGPGWPTNADSTRIVRITARQVEALDRLPVQIAPVGANPRRIIVECVPGVHTVVTY